MVFSLFGRKDKPDPRKSGAGLPHRPPDTTQRGPASTGSGPAADPREIARRTAEKIDQIESEMIASTLAPPPAARQPQAPARSAPPARPAAPARSAPAPAAGSAVPPARAPDYDTSLVLGDSVAAGQIHVGASSLSPEIEEAAILFANGQAPAAASSLQRAIARGDLGASAHQAWMMLFDIHQYAGNKTEFENLAIDFASRFEQSPPPWREAAGAAAPASDRRAPASTQVAFGVSLDASIAKQIEQIQRAASSKRPVTLEFGITESVDADAAQRLIATIGAFEKSRRDLVVLNAERLHAAARARIEPGRRDDDQSFWMLALLALRICGMKQVFDDLSIDYCVTYEVSPPSWEPMPACIRNAPVNDAASAAGAAAEAAPAEPAPGNAFALRGEVAGRIQRELTALRQHASERSDVVIDCRELSRLDFVAAGELLNEVVTLRGSGKVVLIVEPPHVVLALMIVMGIHELAEIRRRKS